MSTEGATSGSPRYEVWVHDPVADAGGQHWWLLATCPNRQYAALVAMGVLYSPRVPFDNDHVEVWAHGVPGAPEAAPEDAGQRGQPVCLDVYDRRPPAPDAADEPSPERVRPGPYDPPLPGD